MARVLVSETEPDDLDIYELKRLADKAYTNSRITRLDNADDLVFAFVTQWDDNMLSASDLSYRGEFNVIAKAMRQVIAELRANEISVTYVPLDETDEEAAEILEGMYRTDEQTNSSLESFFNADQECVACGMGAWEMYTDWETARGRKQVIRRSPIHEANNVVLWDPQSKLMDKSDARYCVVLTRYSKEGYAELLEEMLGEEHDPKNFSEANFRMPQYSYVFPWMAGNFKWIYVASFYYRDKVKDVMLTLMDPITGDTTDYYESDVAEKMDELLATGQEIVKKVECERWRVQKYIASGERIISKSEVACEYIPVITQYGERAFVEGQEVWRGLVKLAKDPQRLRNFLFSYVADMASRSPRPKPLFFPEQVKGYEDMYALNGANNNYPYYLINPVDSLGNPLPQGTAGQMPDQQIPNAVASLIQLTADSAAQVLPTESNVAYDDVELSGYAIAQLDTKINQQSIVFMENRKHARRYDAMVYASFASRISDVPSEVILTMKDGQRQKRSILSLEFNPDSGEMEMRNDLRNARFEVVTAIGPSYATERERMRKEIGTQLQVLPPDDPLRPMLMYKYAELCDGADMEDIRKYAHKQLLIQGFKEPKTPEDQQIVQQAQSEQNKPDPTMMIAEAELRKAGAAEVTAQANIMREQNHAAKIRNEMQNHNVKSEATVFNAQTGRMNANTQRLRTVLDHKAKVAQINSQSAEQQQPMQPPKPATIAERARAVVIPGHPVHGNITEEDIQDTMAAHGLTRQQVLNKLKHNHDIHNELRRAIAVA